MKPGRKETYVDVGASVLNHNSIVGLNEVNMSNSGVRRGVRVGLCKLGTFGNGLDMLLSSGDRVAGDNISLAEDGHLRRVGGEILWGNIKIVLEFTSTSSSMSIDGWEHAQKSCEDDASTHVGLAVSETGRPES
jgi:hypothetical protein